MVSRTGAKHTENHETRDHILQVAESLLMEGGYKKMTIDEVAREAGLGKGTVYLYFQSKEDLAFSCIDHKNGILRERMQSILHRKGAPQERLFDILMERVMWRFDRVQKYTLGIDDMLSALRSRLLTHRARWHDLEAKIIAELLIEGRTLGLFTFEDAFDAANGMIGATNFLLPYSLSCRELGNREDVQHQANVLAKLLVRSVSVCPSCALDGPEKERTNN